MEECSSIAGIVLVYGFGPGKPGGPIPLVQMGGSGCRAKTLAREASDMLQCRFLTIRIL
jgi:hypothetical protein